MNYEEKCGVMFLGFRIFSGCNFDTLFSTAPSETFNVDSKGKRPVLSRGVVRFYASIKVFLQTGRGGVIPPQIIDCEIPPRLTLIILFGGNNKILC